MYKCIIFDVDGTILDTEKAILKSLQKVLREEEGKEYSILDLRFVLGIPGEEALKRLNVSDVARINSIWSQTVLGYSSEVSVFTGVEEVIKQVADSSIKTGIVTSKTKQELIDEFEPFGLSGYFEETVCADDTIKHKPHPEPLLKCLMMLNLEPNESLYIGDSIYDMQCAREAGAHFGLALWGSKTTNGFEADHIFSEPSDILQLVERSR